MASIGDLIFKLMGRENPRDAILAGAGGGAASPPQQDPYAASRGTGGGAPAPAAVPPEPDVLKSPNELMSLYTALMERQEDNRQIDRGLGLMFSSLAQKDNRAGMMASMMGGETQDPTDMISSLMKFQTDQSALAQKAAHRAALPSIAKQYGIDLATAQFLFDSGELDAFIKEAEKPNKQVVQDANGQSSIVDLSDGSVSAPFGAVKKREVELVDDGKGGKMAVYKDDKTPVGKNDIPGRGATTMDQELTSANEVRAQQGLPPLTPEEWKNISNTTTQKRFTDAAGRDVGDPPTDMAWKTDANGKVMVDERGAPIAVTIGGTKTDLEQRKAAAEAADADKAADTKDSNQSITSNIVSQEIDRSIATIERNRDKLFGAAGWGAIIKSLPQTDARFLDQTLNTIKSNVGLDKLQRMRDASPTGAALGPVSDFENQLLQSTIGSLDQFGDPDALIYNLKRVQKAYTALLTQKLTPENVGQILGNDFDAGYLPGKGAQTYDDPEIDAILKKYPGK